MRLIHEDSLRFSMVLYGTLVLLAYLLNNFWIMLAIGVLMGVGSISINYNLFYQLHSSCLRRIFSKESPSPSKDINEARFAGSVAAILLFLAFWLFYFWKLTMLAWVLAGLVMFLNLLAGATGICVGSLMYVFFRKIFRGKENQS